MIGTSGMPSLLRQP